MKFDNPMHATSITPALHYHMPSQLVSPHPYSQDVDDTLNLTTIPSNFPLTNSTHATNPNIPTNPISPPHLNHVSSWKRIFRLLSKRYAISQVVEDNKQILAKAGYQPCQKQWVF